MPFALVPVALSAPNAGGPGDAAPDRDWDLRHLHLDVAIDPAGRSVAGTVTLTLAPLLPGSAWIRLDQVALDITSVRVDGDDTPFHLEDDGLLVELPRPDETLELAVTYRGEPDNGLHFRGDGPDAHVEVWSQGEGEDNRFWFPSWDYPNDRFTYSGRFEVPEGFKVLSNGLGHFEDGAWHYALEQELVSYLIMVAVGRYEIREDTWGEVPVQQWVPPGTDMAAVETLSGDVPAMLDHFSETTGVRYPYPAYREVFVQRFLYGGMENTTSTVETTRMLVDPDRRTHARYVVAHELAHHWYGDLLTCATWHELWLNEGFATYFGHDWMRTTEGEAFWYDGVHRRYRSALGSGPLAGRRWSRGHGHDGHNSAVYVRGASVLQMLRVLFGEEAFAEAIHRYTHEHADQLVTTEDLRQAFEEVTGHHLRWFFEQWAHRPGTPVLDAQVSWTDGQLAVKLRQTQDTSGDTPIFTLPVDLDIATADGVLRERVWMTEADHTFSRALDEPPLYVAVDPEGGLLADLTVHQNQAAWRAQLDSERVYARLQAVRALSDTPDEASIEALITLARSPLEERTTRLLAVEGLGGKGDTQAQGTLLHLLEHDDDPHVREAAANALGRGVGTGDEVQALTDALRTDPDTYVRAAALGAIVHHDPDAALRQARALARQADDPLGALASRALAVLGEYGGWAELPIVLQRARTDELHTVATAALRAAVRLVDRQDPGPAREEAFSLVARQAEPFLDSAFLKTRRAAVDVLADCGDPRAVTRLQAYRSQETVPSLRSAAQRAITDIRKRDPDRPPRSDAQWEARLEELEDRIAELEAE